jgi:hypothetical protein
MSGSCFPETACSAIIGDEFGSYLGSVDHSIQEHIPPADLMPTAEPSTIA